MKAKFGDKSRIIKVITLLLYKLRLLELSFYVKAYLWHLTNKPPKNLTITDVHRLFYIHFLKVPPHKMEIVERTENSIFTKCFHDCPILSWAHVLGKDTREVCRKISKGPSEYFIRKLGRNIIVDNEYYRIRPHLPSCEETITIVH